MKPRLYLETTIPSYLTSGPSRDLIIASHQQITKEWWEKRRSGFDIYISQLVLDEARAGDPTAAWNRLKVLQALPLLEITPEVVELASGIVACGKIPQKGRHGRRARSHRGSTWNGLPGNLELRAYC